MAEKANHHIPWNYPFLHHNLRRFIEQIERPLLQPGQISRASRFDILDIGSDAKLSRFFRDLVSRVRIASNIVVEMIDF